LQVLPGENEHSAMLSGLPVITYRARKLCAERISGGADGGYYTAAGGFFLVFFCVFYVLLCAVKRPAL